MGTGRLWCIRQLRRPYVRQESLGKGRSQIEGMVRVSLLCLLHL